MTIKEVKRNNLMYNQYKFRKQPLLDEVLGHHEK